MQNKQELINQLQILAPDIDVEALIGNIEINGNDNIVIKGVNNSTINIHQITKEVLLAAIKKLTQPPKYLNNITYLRSDTVFGREDDIANIKQKLFQDKQLLLVSAIGGVGKTTAAIYYAKQYEKEYAHILWMNGERGVEDQLLTDAELLTNLKLDTQVKMLIEAKDRETALALVKNKLKSLDKPVLWIVDNAEKETRKAIRQLQNTFVEHHFLITSRGTEKEIPTYRLDNLLQTAAIDLFYYHCERIEKDDDSLPFVQDLVEKVLRHALTVQLLAKTLQNDLHVSLADFVQNLDEQTVYLKKKIDIEADNYEQTYIYDILEYVFNISKIAHNAPALHFLEQASILPSQNLQYQHLNPLLVTDNYPVADLNVGLNDLIATGWLELADKTKLIYTYHPVIQEIVREKFQPDEEKCGEIIMFLGIKIYNTNQINRLQSVEWLPYVDSILQKIPDETAKIAGLANDISNVYQTIDYFEKSLEYSLKALKIREKILSPEDINLAISYGTLGNTYYNMGDFEKSLECQVKASLIFEKNPSTEYSHLATLYSNMGETYRIVNDLAKSLYYGLKALEINKKKYSAEHPNLAISYSNVGEAYKAMGDLKESLNYALKALAIKEKILSPKHYSLATSYHNTADTYYYLCHWEEALSFVQKALKIRLKELPFEHNNTKSSVNTMNIILQSAITAKGKEWTQPYIDWFLENCKAYLEE